MKGRENELNQLQSRFFVEATVRHAPAMKRLLGSAVFLLISGYAGLAHAQLGVGDWTRTDAQGRGMTMTVEVCCNGGYRLTYHVPLSGGQPAMTLVVNSPMDGSEAPALIAGKPSGETMAIKRVDARHYSGVVKMNGQVISTSNGTLSADGKSLSVETVSQGDAQKIMETWVKK
jgi:hypothetical protein